MSGAPGEKYAVAVLKESDVVIPMASMIKDFPRELIIEIKTAQDIASSNIINPSGVREKIQKEIAQLEADITRLEARLKDEAFLSKAPVAVVAKEKERLAERKERVGRLKGQIGI